MKVYGVRIHQPDSKERAKGAVAQVFLTVDRDLKSGKLDEIPMSEDDIIRTIAGLGEKLAILRGLRDRR